MENSLPISVDIIYKYFPKITEQQKKQFEKLFDLYTFWNAQINVISRKDIEQLYLKHILHSLAIAKYVQFPDNCKVLDIGTGGGFPGVPLAILFPNVHFHLIDGIGKKIKVVEEVVNALDLKNCIAENTRAENVKLKYHYIVSRAVTALPQFKEWTFNKFEKDSIPGFKENGLIFLKGGDLTQEINEAKLPAVVTPISKFFHEDFFETKKIMYINYNSLFKKGK